MTNQDRWEMMPTSADVPYQGDRARRYGFLVIHGNIVDYREDAAYDTLDAATEAGKEMATARYEKFQRERARASDIMTGAAPALDMTQESDPRIAQLLAREKASWGGLNEEPHDVLADPALVNRVAAAFGAHAQTSPVIPAATIVVQEISKQAERFMNAEGGERPTRVYLSDEAYGALVAAMHVSGEIVDAMEVPPEVYGGPFNGPLKNIETPYGTLDIERLPDELQGETDVIVLKSDLDTVLRMHELKSRARGEDMASDGMEGTGGD